MKIVVNKCHGGFGLSEAGVKKYAEIKGLPVFTETDPKIGLPTFWTVPPEQRPEPLEGDAWWKASEEKRREHNIAYESVAINDRAIPRDDPALIEVVETLGAAANGPFAELEVTEIPDGVEWQIEEYDGKEWVAETHLTW